MATLEERIAKINDKASAELYEAVERERKIRVSNERLRARCENLFSRVEELMVLARHCIKNGIQIGQRGYASCDKDFYTNGIGHPCGFSSKPCYNTQLSLDRSSILGIGIDGGGVWGYSYIVLTDSGDILFDDRTLRSLAAQNTAMRELLTKFDGFEARFLEFIDNF